MTGRTLRIGEETLSVGDTVVVFDGNSQRERKILAIGTRRVQLEGDLGNPVAYSLENRKNCEKRGFSSYFRTKTEVQEMKVRDSLKSRLLELGIHFRMGLSHSDSLSIYPNSVLEQVVAVLQNHLDQANKG